ncbi:MAG: YciI family protein [Solirubrobacterales bacterium]
MRVMVLVKASSESEAGQMPSQELLAEMGAFNEDLVEAGVMLDGEGLHPSAKGVRVTIPEGDGTPTVTDGPFAEAEELVAGYWIWQVRDMDEALAWAKRIPNPGPGPAGTVELRPVLEAEDFGEALPPELREREEQLRKRLHGDD